MIRKPILTAIWMLLFATIFAANTLMAQSVTRAFCGEDGKAHLVFASGATQVIHSEPSQVGCADIAVAEDSHTVGWAMLVENCCTSYPIAVGIVLFKDNRKLVLPTNQTVWRWRFAGAGRQVAILSGPVHGEATDAILYDARNAKQLASWNGRGTPPIWARGWEDDFSSGQQ